MKVADLVHCSLTKTRVERLIVCLGFLGFPARSGAACRVADRLLANCRPPPNDVHNSYGPRTRSRNTKGEERPYYAALTHFARKGKMAPGLRRPQEWDSSPVADYAGLWCDRLLLGVVHDPRRTALLVPQVPPFFQPEAVERVGRSLSLSSDEVLLVDTTPALPLGAMRLWDVEEYFASVQWEGTKVRRRQRQRDEGVGGMYSIGCSMEAALSFFTPSSSCSIQVLAIGCGAEAAPVDPFTANEEGLLRNTLLPLAAFTAALWTVGGTAAARHLSEALSPRPQPGRERLWGEMQASMLSTRDTALLVAHRDHTRLDPRLTPERQTYLAETLLRRLGDRLREE